MVSRRTLGDVADTWGQKKRVLESLSSSLRGLKMAPWTPTAGFDRNVLTCHRGKVRHRVCAPYREEVAFTYCHASLESSPCPNKSPQMEAASCLSRRGCRSCLSPACPALGKEDSLVLWHLRDVNTTNNGNHELKWPESGRWTSGTVYLRVTC